MVITDEETIKKRGIRYHQPTKGIASVFGSKKAIHISKNAIPNG